MGIRLAIAGASGRMGRMLVEAALADPAVEISVALERSDSPELGRDCGELLGRRTAAAIGADLARLADADVLIDFTRPEGTLAHLDSCRRLGVKMVIGTTGFDDAGKRAIRAASESIGMVFAPNMSVGVNAIESPEDLLDLLAGDRVGQSATLRMLRGGTASDVTVTVGERLVH